MQKNPKDIYKSAILSYCTLRDIQCVNEYLEGFVASQNVNEQTAKPYNLYLFSYFFLKKLNKLNPLDTCAEVAAIEIMFSVFGKEIVPMLELSLYNNLNVANCFKSNSEFWEKQIMLPDDVRNAKLALNYYFSSLYSIKITFEDICQLTQKDLEKALNVPILAMCRKANDVYLKVGKDCHLPDNALAYPNFPKITHFIDYGLPTAYFSTCGAMVFAGQDKLIEVRLPMQMIDASVLEMPKTTQPKPTRRERRKAQRK